MKLTKKEAKALSTEKWELIIDAGGDLSWRDYPSRINLLRGSCGYCEKYFNTFIKTLDCCGICPIRPKIKDYDDLTESGCCQEYHPFSKWKKSRTVESAQAVLDLILKS